MMIIKNYLLVLRLENISTDRKKKDRLEICYIITLVLLTQIVMKYSNCRIFYTIYSFDVIDFVLFTSLFAQCVGDCKQKLPIYLLEL